MLPVNLPNSHLQCFRVYEIKRRQREQFLYCDHTGEPITDYLSAADRYKVAN